MDHYAVLGLPPEASLADIKRAYRRLARRYHPGINPGDRTAEAMFRRISEAYETLTDPVRREQYDARQGGGTGHGSASRPLEFAGFDFSTAAQGTDAATFSELFAEVLHPLPPGERGGPQAGADLHASLVVPFVDALGGVRRQIVVTRQDVCPACRGSGQVAVREGRCAPCQGSGTLRWARGHMVFSKPCGACGGAGRVRQQRCGGCAAQGRIVRTDAVPILVPPGTPDGVRIRLAGQGHAGRHGGPAGDLYVTVHVAPHPLFRREGDDLVIEVPVAVHEAVLGTRIAVPSLDGEVKLRVPPGTQPGQRLRVRGRGGPTLSGERGDLVAEIRLVLPQVVDERSKDLIREFGRLNDEDVRRGWGM
jgi:molecular chaperone DnaJ